MTTEKIYKPYENWTKFPNIVLDNIHRYTPDEFKILGVMVRQNLGFTGNENLSFSYSYLENKSGLCRRKVAIALKNLLKMQSIESIAGKGIKGAKQYRIIWSEPEEITREKYGSNGGTGSPPELPNGSPVELVAGSPQEHIKRNNLKETRIKETSTASPVARLIVDSFWQIYKKTINPKPPRELWFTAIKAAEKLGDHYSVEQAEAILSDIAKRRPDLLSVGMIPHWEKNMVSKTDILKNKIIEASEEYENDKRNGGWISSLFQRGKQNGNPVDQELPRISGNLDIRPIQPNN